MKKLLIIALFVAGAYLLYRSMKFRPFIKPFIRRKCDRYGCGTFGASRDGGSRKHNGMDVISREGQPVFAPFGGKVRTFNPYKGYTALDGIEISGRVYKVKLMYVLPAVNNGDIVKAGQVIGWAQSLQSKYPGIPDHIHCEVWASGRALNPSGYFPADSIIQV